MLRGARAAYENKEAQKVHQSTREQPRMLSTGTSTVSRAHLQLDVPECHPPLDLRVRSALRPQLLGLLFRLDFVSF